MYIYPRSFALLTPILKFFVTSICVSLAGCIVVPKKVVSYEAECKTSMNRIELDVALIKSGDSWIYPNSNYDWDFPEEIATATFTMAASAIVSGSIAAAGNAYYRLENLGDCGRYETSTFQSATTPSSEPQSETSNDIYLIEEEIVSAKPAHYY